jgi:WD40-like Beta Propeller Repeat
MRKTYQKFVYGRGDPCSRPGAHLYSKGACSRPDAHLYSKGARSRPGARHPAHHRHPQRFAVILALALLSGAAALFIRQGILNAHSAPHQSASAQGTCQQQGFYRYFTLKQPGGFVLARAAGGSSGQPLGAPQPVANFGNDFGRLESDAVFSMQLSPDGCYLAIDGASDHDEQVWVFDARRMSLAPVPANVSGNFLNWLPATSSASGNGGHTFLYRPLLPLGPGAPRVNGAWNPGLWIVDAATGQYRNIDIHMPSAFLVDAASSPDGSRIVYSTSYGVGMGSDTWMMNSDGSHQARLFYLAGGAQSIVAMFSWSPDGSMIAYERLSDSPVPFQPAGLWVMSSSGTASRRLADADGGHGFTLAWSPGSHYIAYIARTNNDDRAADYDAQSLQCAVAVTDVTNGASSIVAAPAQTGAQFNDNPQWIANGPGQLSITFTAYNPFNLVLGGSPRYWSAQVVRATGLVQHQAQFQATPLSPALSHVVAIGS